MLRSWLKDNSYKNSLGYYLVQWLKNSSQHRVIGRSSYKALLGVDFPVHQYSTNLPADTIESLTIEEGLEELLGLSENRSAGVILLDMVPSIEKGCNAVDIADMPIIIADTLDGSKIIMDNDTEGVDNGERKTNNVNNIILSKNLVKAIVSVKCKKRKKCNVSK